MDLIRVWIGFLEKGESGILSRLQEHDFQPALSFIANRSRGELNTGTDNPVVFELPVPRYPYP
jgi:hypothetical protein